MGRPHVPSNEAELLSARLAYVMRTQRAMAAMLVEKDEEIAKLRREIADRIRECERHRPYERARAAPAAAAGRDPDEAAG
jgi:hypothetical protein